MALNAIQSITELTIHKGGQMRSLESKLIETEDHAKLHYIFRSGNPCIILIHGLACDYTLWIQVTENLPDGFGLLIPDMRGHGQSTLGCNTPSIELFARDILFVADKERIKNPIVCGMSMGGYITFALANIAPDFAGGYGFFDTAAGNDPPEGKVNRAADIELMRNSGWEKRMENHTPNLLWVDGPDFQKVKEHAFEMAKKAGEVGICYAQTAISNRPDSRPFLEKVDKPVMVAVGEHDKLTPIEKAREIADPIPKSNLVTIPNAAHFSPTENPQGVAQCIKGLISK